MNAINKPTARTGKNNMEELFDVFTIDKRPVGKTCLRGSTLKDNEFHIVVMAVIINGNGEILLTKRSKNKTAAGKWECTAGSVLAGESSKEALIREVREEIGIPVIPKGGIPIGNYIEDDAIFDIWPIKTGYTTSELLLQEEEVDEAKYATVSEIKKMIEAGTATKSLEEVVKLIEKGIININE